MWSCANEQQWAKRLICGSFAPVCSFQTAQLVSYRCTNDLHVRTAVGWLVGFSPPFLAVTLQGSNWLTANPAWARGAIEAISPKGQDLWTPWTPPDTDISFRLWLWHVWTGPMVLPFEGKSLFYLSRGNLTPANDNIGLSLWILMGRLTA